MARGATTPPGRFYGYIIPAQVANVKQNRRTKCKIWGKRALAQVAKAGTGARNVGKPSPFRSTRVRGGSPAPGSQGKATPGAQGSLLITNYLTTAGNEATDTKF